MGEQRLHLTNGDVAAELLRRSSVGGTVLPWRDVLHEGPVPGGKTLAELSGVRARYLAEDCGFAPYRQVLRELRERDAALEESSRYDEVVLWFEHDLYDQLQILQLLAWFADTPLRPRLALVCIDRFPGVEPFHGLGQLTPAQLAGLLDGREAIEESHLALGAAGWMAFTAPDPLGLERYRAGDLSALPFMADAVQRFLQEYPSVEDGLGRTERQVLELLAESPTRPGRLFAASQAREAAPFMGDWVFWRRIAALCAPPDPLVACTPGAFAFPPGSADDERFRRQALSLTPAGEAVLAGHAVHPVRETWLGGTHLAPGRPAWRWHRAGGHLRDCTHN